MGWACGAYGWGLGMYRVLVGKAEGRRPLGRPRRRWVDIRMDLQEVGCGYMDWIGLAQDRDRFRTLVSAVMNFRVPWNTRNFLTSCKPVSFSRRNLNHGVNKYRPNRLCLPTRGLRFLQLNTKTSGDHRTLAEADMFFLLLNSPHLPAGCTRVQYFSVILSYALHSGTSQFKCNGARAETRFRLSCETDESI